MLTIRPHQAQAFKTEQIRRFERDAVRHVRVKLPQHYGVLGEQGTLGAVRQGIAGATAHGLETKLGVTVYLRLMFVFGVDFADRFEWAREALANHADDEAIRVERLSSAALRYAAALASGQDG
jgi:hypothetical protein